VACRAAAALGLLGRDHLPRPGELEEQVADAAADRAERAAQQDERRAGPVMRLVAHHQTATRRGARLRARGVLRRVGRGCGGEDEDDQRSEQGGLGPHDVSPANTTIRPARVRHAGIDFCVTVNCRRSGRFR
jgi:hypothetical protein